MAKLKKKVLQSRGNPIHAVNEAIAMAEAEGNPLGDDYKKLLIAAAVREMCNGTVSQSELEAFLNSMEGAVAVLHVIVSERRHDFTEEDAWKYFERQAAALAANASANAPAPASDTPVAAVSDDDDATALAGLDLA